ncbi:rod shape-determining protein MreC, partial [Candidatus Symbiothrix dinenymphae]|uniref:rod shape-determining protein MreC n=1 Tax=Candidatus Symbiothrix dinenymphae TaxID=467085 RepID=UPI000A754A14
HGVLFVLLFSTSIMLTVNNNRFQRSKFLAATQEVIGSFYAVTAVFYAYIELRTINEDMMQRIVDLENQIAEYRNTLKLTNDTLHTGNLDIDQSGKTYHWVSAKVVNNNISKIDNYLTLDKGELDGIEADMGVVSPRGIVGVVKQVSAHFSQVIPV